MRVPPPHLELAVAATLALAACAGSPPKLKQGLWEVHLQTEEKPAGKTADVAYQICRDHAYDKKMDALLKNLPGCRTVTQHAGGGKFSSASNCVINGTTVLSSGFTTFVSGTATHSETQARYSPPVSGKTEESMSQDQHYVARCPAGVKPGDTIGADGLVRHHD